MVNHMTAYLETSESVDAQGLLTALASACREIASAGVLTRACHASANLAACCLPHASEPAALSLEFVDDVPLVAGLDFLVNIGMRHAEVRGVQPHKIKEATVFIGDLDAVQNCIASWTARAIDLFATDVLKEPDLFTVLYGLANLGRASDEKFAIQALKQLCMLTPGGLKHFLRLAAPSKDFNDIVFFLYVWDADEMADLVEASTVAADHDWYIARLRSNRETRQLIAQRNGVSPEADISSEADGKPGEAAPDERARGSDDAEPAKGTDGNDG
ncbi:hypothetical protein B0G80_3684 [Paraburkholderia sp. BL6669N2]|uniref:hypothetical protein n=1 Tax=Paraburkholderia sp. BL6669N2 TaxID=1938807 RepID=UPI000E260237|nr:hypothetical protein [Paraburkholderia sp. BL6669N2]REG60860.1 hypothetical protein B0G80_3684 [Paraburkholderia sp. BL6669N2]